jgi:ABC-type dipeptide/oligopeptide/nickel transport system permease component
MLMDFAPLEKLAQRLVWMAILGAGLVVVGLVFGLALGIWSAARSVGP